MKKQLLFALSFVALTAFACSDDTNDCSAIESHEIDHGWFSIDEDKCTSNWGCDSGYVKSSDKDYTCVIDAQCNLACVAPEHGTAKTDPTKCQCQYFCDTGYLLTYENTCIQEEIPVCDCATGENCTTDELEQCQTNKPCALECLPLEHGDVTINQTRCECEYQCHDGYTFDGKQCVKNSVVLPEIHIDGGKFVDPDGKEFVFLGTNLGGWLVQEYWMTPVYDPDITKVAQTDIIKTLTERFGSEKAWTLLKTYRDNWITEYDFELMQKEKLNVIRVPVGVWDFQNPDGSAITEYKPEGFERLDWVIDTAAKYGIYTIIDMHGYYQTTDHCTGAHKKLLFKNDVSKSYQNGFLKLWLEISNRYKDNTNVIAYDLLNEPDDSDAEERNALYLDAYKKIRDNGDNTIIFIESWTTSNLPKLPDAQYTNMTYSIHSYNRANNEDDWSLTPYDANWVKARVNKATPYFLGEYASHYITPLARKYGPSVTNWAWKDMSHHNGAWFHYYKSKISINTKTMNYDQILDIWGNTLQTKNKWKELTLTTDSFTK